MIIDFSSLVDFDSFFDKLEERDLKNPFRFKQVKLIKDLYIRDFDGNIKDNPKYRDIIKLDYDEIYIPAETTCELRRVDGEIVLVINEIILPIHRTDFEECIMDIELSELGERCIERNNNIDEIFDTRDCIVNIEKFIENAPKTFALAFTIDELYEHFRTDKYIAEDCEYDKWIDDFLSTITNQLYDAVKSINNNDIEGPDDSMIHIVKCADSYSNNEHEFSLKGRLVCCFYSQNTKIQLSDLRKAILSYNFNKIDITDVNSVPDTPGISFNGIYSSDKITYVECRFKMNYSFNGEM